MKRPRLSDDALRAALRSGDPVAGEPGLDETERTELLRAALRAVPTPRPAAFPSRLRWATAFALVLVGAVATVLLRGWGTEAPEIQDEDAVASGPVTRQIDFTTPGGTRLIWVFDDSGPKENP